MNIHFINVGHGDSVIVEYLESITTKIGLIDCNIHDGENEVVNFIKRHSIGRIEFLIISHPHKDHISGVIDLLNFCSENQITIGTVYDSCLFESVGQYIDLTSRNEGALITNTMEHLDQSYENGLIENWHGIDENSKFLNVSNYEILVRAPQRSQLRTFKAQLRNRLKDNRKSRPDLNLLCTIIEIHKKDQYVLLCSDSVKDVFGAIRQKLSNKLMVMCQVPHHGSRNNLSKPFWGKIKRHPQCHAIISCGSSCHNLPDYEVVEFFDQNDYFIRSTNHVNGVKTYFEKKPRSNISNILNQFNRSLKSYSANNNDYAGSQVFNF